MKKTPHYLKAELIRKFENLFDLQHKLIEANKSVVIGTRSTFYTNLISNIINQIKIQTAEIDGFIRAIDISGRSDKNGDTISEIKQMAFDNRMRMDPDFRESAKKHTHYTLKVEPVAS